MYSYILDLLPYKSSFRFVEEIAYVDADKVVGHYTLRPDAFFYADHFPGNPVTPGAILTEIMAQIGLVVLGIYLITEGKAPDAGQTNSIFPLLSSANVEFYKMALPGQKLTVTSKKEYFRFDKLKCQVEMHDAAGERVAKGTFAGFLKRI
ncbi:MAG TPA: hydroxymyristoyl-ACP dehydratase [Puia sp.]|nr:hydroxymyristoyl-ACP dehydratase [Puia sp.]